jgi:tetratricopeptide (TPR) repeat protein
LNRIFGIFIACIFSLSLIVTVNAVENNVIDVERSEKLIQTGNYYGLLAYTNDPIQTHPDDLNVLFYRGVGFWGTSNYDGAITFLDKVLDVEPEHKRALYFKSKSLTAMNKFDEAFITIDKALEIDPNYDEAKLQKEKILTEMEPSSKQNIHSEAERQARFATSFAQDGNFEEAHQIINLALNLEPSNVNVLNDKGWILLQEGKLEESLIWFDKAL